MVLKIAFHISKVHQEGDCQLLDGRLLEDISLSDNLLFVEGIDINDYMKYRDKDRDMIIVDEHIFCQNIKLLSIQSYQRYWDFLNKGMTARLKCKCNFLKENDILFKRV